MFKTREPLPCHSKQFEKFIAEDLRVLSLIPFRGWVFGGLTGFCTSVIERLLHLRGLI